MAATPFVLPVGEVLDDWAEPLELGGMEVAGAAGEGASIVVVVDGGQWVLQAADEAGSVRTATVGRPHTAADREGVVWLATSLLKQVGRGADPVWERTVERIEPPVPEAPEAAAPRPTALAPVAVKPGGGAGAGGPEPAAVARAEVLPTVVEPEEGVAPEQPLPRGRPGWEDAILFAARQVPVVGTPVRSTPERQLTPEQAYRILAAPWGWAAGGVEWHADSPWAGAGVIAGGFGLGVVELGGVLSGRLPATLLEVDGGSLWSVAGGLSAGWQPVHRPLCGGARRLALPGGALGLRGAVAARPGGAQAHRHGLRRQRPGPTRLVRSLRWHRDRLRSMGRRVTRPARSDGSAAAPRGSWAGPRRRG